MYYHIRLPEQDRTLKNAMFKQSHRNVFEPLKGTLEIGYLSREAEELEMCYEQDSGSYAGYENVLKSDNGKVAGTAKVAKPAGKSKVWPNCTGPALIVSSFHLSRGTQAAIPHTFLHVQVLGHSRVF